MDKNTARSTRPDAHTIRKLAVASCTDPRSVLKVITGENVRSVTRARVMKAMRRFGLELAAFGSPGGAATTTARAPERGDDG